MTLEMRDGLDDHLMQTLYVARAAGDIVRPGGALVFMGGTGARRPRPGLALVSRPSSRVAGSSSPAWRSSSPPYR